MTATDGQCFADIVSTAVLDIAVPHAVAVKRAGGEPESGVAQRVSAPTIAGMNHRDPCGGGAPPN